MSPAFVIATEPETESPGPTSDALRIADPPREFDWASTPDARALWALGARADPPLGISATSATSAAARIRTAKRIIDFLSAKGPRSLSETALAQSLGWRRS